MNPDTACAEDNAVAVAARVICGPDGAADGAAAGSCVADPIAAVA
jgi:hypothetical protein